MKCIRFCLALCVVALLSGCTRKVVFVLFNYTRQSITVQEDDRSVIIPAGGHKELGFGGSRDENSNLYGPIVQAGTHRWFYPTYSPSAHRDLIEVPGGYQHDVGLNAGYYVALDERGSLYLLSSPSQSLADARTSQPPGFPLKPQ